MHACKLNTKLLDASSNVGQAMDEQLLTHWRRTCFLRLNDVAVQMFNSSDWKSVCRGLELVSELVIPCIPKLIVSAQAADGLAVEQVRNCWCNFLASPLDGKKPEIVNHTTPGTTSPTLYKQDFLYAQGLWNGAYGLSSLSEKTR